MLKQPHSGFMRIPYTQRCRLTRAGETQSGVLCNISVLGVYLTVDVIPEVDEIVAISFLLPGSADPIEVTARVTWQNLEEPQTADGLPAGCGLRFEQLAPHDHARIEALVFEFKDRPLGIGAAVPKSGFVRVPYVQRCRVAVRGESRPGVVCNLSALGVYVTMEHLPEVGAAVHISFLLPGDPHSFQAKATVTWKNPEDPQRVDSLAPGFGLKFDDLPAPERQRIERVVQDYCAGSTPAD